MIISAHSDSGTDSEFWAIVNTMGHASLIETLKLAAYFIHNSDRTFSSRSFVIHMREAESCYIFVQGTGLELMINKFGMLYNSDIIKDKFNYYVRHP